MPDFRILGPLEVSDETGPLLLGGLKQRAVLALLLLDAGRVVSTDRLIDALWGEQPPRAAATSLQNFVSQLRKTLGPDVLQTKPPGYVFRVGPEQLDLTQFVRLVDEARDKPAVERAAALREALALWRGPALADFRFEAFAASESERLEELRLAALEDAWTRISKPADTPKWWASSSRWSPRIRSASACGNSSCLPSTGRVGRRRRSRRIRTRGAVSSRSWESILAR